MPRRPRIARGGLRALVLAGLLAAVVLVGAAYAAEHTYNDYRHGITNEGRHYDSNTGSTFDWYRAKTYDVDDDRILGQIWAYGYHYTSTREWQQKCGVYSGAAYWEFCDFDPGNYPCSKYAWSAGDDGSGGDLAWHGHNPVFC